jgi:hypothetical protein
MINRWLKRLEEWGYSCPVKTATIAFLGLFSLSCILDLLLVPNRFLTSPLQEMLSNILGPVLYGVMIYIVARRGGNSSGGKAG